VTIELFLDIDLGFREIIEFAGVAGNCASHRSQTPRTGISFRSTILSLLLGISAVSQEDVTPVEIKRHHYPQACVTSSFLRGVKEWRIKATVTVSEHNFGHDHPGSNHAHTVHQMTDDARPRRG
jgi:hypothetical protein